RGDVVRLPGTAVEEQTGRRVDQPAVPAAPGLGFAAPTARRRRSDGVRALEVHADHVVPLGFGQVEDHARPPDAGVVHDDVDAAPLVEGALDHRFAALGRGDVAAVGNGFAAGGADL